MGADRPLLPLIVLPAEQAVLAVLVGFALTTAKKGKLEREVAQYQEILAEPMECTTKCYEQLIRKELPLAEILNCIDSIVVNEGWKTEVKWREMGEVKWREMG